MDSRVVLESLLVHLVETTLERDQARARVAELEAQLAKEPDA